MNVNREPIRLPASFTTLVLDDELEAIFLREGQKLARAVDKRRGRRAVAMVQEAALRGVSPQLVEFYRRTLFEGFMQELNQPPRGANHGRVKHHPADGRASVQNRGDEPSV